MHSHTARGSSAQGRCSRRVAGGCETERGACLPDESLELRSTCPQSSSQPPPFPSRLCTKPRGIPAHPCDSRRGGCTVFHATEETWTCTSLYAACYINYMGGNSLCSTTNYLVNTKIAAGSWLPKTAPLCSTAQCRAGYPPPNF